MRRILAGLVLILMLTGGAAAGPFEDGVAAHERGDYATALRLWRPLAEQGTADAQYKLGVMYAKGRGFPQDYAEAAKWFRLAAEQGDADAQFNLGTMYNKGRGVPQDYVQAHMWFNLAASRYPASEAEDRDLAVKNRDIAAYGMTPKVLAEAQKLAREWKPK
jgi:TPR repeat protein